MKVCKDGHVTKESIGTNIGVGLASREAPCTMVSPGHGAREEGGGHVWLMPHDTMVEPGLGLAQGALVHSSLDIYIKKKIKF